MRFAATEGECTIEALIERLYRIEGRGAAGVARHARKELLSLNPQLKEMAGVAEGTAILVPDIEGAEVAVEGVPPPRVAAGALVEDVKAAFEATLKALGRSIGEERDDARRSIELLRSREAKAAAENVPGAADQMKSTLAGAQQRLEDVEALELYRRMLVRRGGRGSG